MLYDSSGDNRFETNAFIGNMTPLTLVGRRTDTVFAGNYWSGNREPDLDGDGRSDRPYRLASLFDHMRGNLPAADLFADGLAAAALVAAEATFPVLEPIEVVDPAPLVNMPSLAAVPRADVTRRTAGAELPVYAAVTLLGIGVMRPRPWRKDGRS